MKTNQNMIRKMGDFEVVQRTKDQMFNATSLLKQWNEHSGQQKQMAHFTDNSSTKEFIKTLKKEESYKERNSVLIKSRGKYGGTWMHPFLFIDFAMWINPTFKYQVIKFVYDELIKNRHLAGDNYKTFCSAVHSIASNCDFSIPAKWLNYVVFNTHKPQIRNEASQDQLEVLQRLEKKYADLISEGYIKDLSTLKQKLLKEWKKRHAQTPLALA